MTLDTKLNPDYTFENLVIYDGNQFATGACKAVACNPRRSYNPLFICGSNGLGKTHLLHAIGHQISLANPARHYNIVYVTTERFTSELINALLEGRKVKFKDKYRNVDVLLMDDIQFLVNKERTQEEYFYTFNELCEAQKQIVIACDLSPRRLPTFHKRLRSLFQWGLIADIFAPAGKEIEAMVKQKARAKGLSLSDDVAAFIAEHIPKNFMIMEGFVTRLQAANTIQQREMNLAEVQEAIKELLEPKVPPSPGAIQQIVAKYFGITPKEITGNDSCGRYLYPRHIAMFLMVEVLKIPRIEIARSFNRKDAASITRAYRKITTRMTEEAGSRRDLENIRNLLLLKGF